MKLEHAAKGLLMFAALLAASAVARAQDTAAEVVSLRGSATAVSASGVSRSLSEGDPLFQGERIETAADSALSMRFTDGTTFQLAQSTAMSVDAYSYRRDTDRDSFSTSIFKGAFRFISGLIARSRSTSMGVRTPVATIGIRGTSVAGETDATSARIVLLEPEEPRPTAIEVSNAFGSVTIDEPGFGTEIPDASSPPSPPRRMQLQTIQNLMRTLQSIGRIRPPRIR